MSPHHITQRSNNRQDVFCVNYDRRACLGILVKQCRGFGFTVNVYCLMTNHVHIVGTPQHEASHAASQQKDRDRGT
ncbi:MAG: hypothetical protein ACE5E5_04635 [Phycisphaerae bacterium]